MDFAGKAWIADSRKTDFRNEVSKIKRNAELFLTDQIPKRIFIGEAKTKMNDVNICIVNQNKLVDIKEVKINTDLPDTQRMLDFVQQIGNPYCYLCNGMVVKTRFVGNQSLEDCIRASMFTE